MNRLGFLLLAILPIAGCSFSANLDSQPSSPTGSGDSALSNTFVLPLLYSEYPSWGAFATASDLGLIDGRPGYMGPIEKKHNVDIDLRLRTYDTCLTEYGSNGGAVCITNTDIVGLVKGRPSTAILPTSTSFGADACVVINVKDTEVLKKVTVYGLEKSVSDYAFTRSLQDMGLNPADFKFVNRDPEAGATALQAGSIQAAMLWNPFVVQTLKTQPNSRVLFDTTTIPGEVIDMVVIDNATLEKPGGKAAAQCVVDTYYAVCSQLTDSKTSEEAFTSLKDRFAPNLTTNEMRSICQVGGEATKGYKTLFYDTPKKGATVFSTEHFDPIMYKVLKWAQDRQLVEGQVNFYDRKTVDSLKSTPDQPFLIFDDTFIKASK